MMTKEEVKVRDEGRLPLAPIKRLIQLSGEQERVSLKAAELMRDHLEKELKEIGRKSHKISKFAGRKTITEVDMKMVLEEL